MEEGSPLHSFGGEVERDASAGKVSIEEGLGNLSKSTRCLIVGRPCGQHHGFSNSVILFTILFCCWLVRASPTKNWGEGRAQ